MKKLLLLFAMCGVLAFALTINASDAPEAEEYDEDLYGPQDPIIWTKPVKSVAFYHKTHTMDAELDCDYCHDDLFEMEAGAAQENDDFTMESLYEGSYCGACHDGSTAFASDTRCASCHIGVRGHARLMGGSEKETENAH